MIKLTFMINREIFNIFVDGSEIWYKDRKWEKGIRCIPKDSAFIMKVRMSRNKLPEYLIELFNLTDKEQEEYKSCNGDEKKIALFCIKDAKSRGGKLLNMEKTN